MRLGLYAGGFLGRFGGAILAVLTPELRDAFGAGTAAAVGDHGLARAVRGISLISVFKFGGAPAHR
jgi:hypothetical protein